MNQPTKSITLYLVTNDENQTKKITLPMSYFKVSAFIIAVVVISLFAGLIDYFGLLAQSIENKKLKKEVFTCHFKNTATIDQIFILLKETRNINYKIKNNEITIF